MNNLFNQTDKDDIINRIDELHPDSKPIWGKMGVSQMLAHCIVPAKVSLGEATPKRNVFGILFGKTAKKKLMGEKPFPKNLPTDPSFVIKQAPDFYEKQMELKNVIEKLYNSNKDSLAKKHPFFGNMTADDWGILSYKHLDHHLKQFGV